MNDIFYTFDLDIFQDDRGELVSLLNQDNLPFELKRIYYIRANKDATRANLAHKTLKQILVSVSGKCKVSLDDGQSITTIDLDRSNKALYINELIWRKISDFSQDCVLLSLNSEDYDENEIVRDYDEFLNLKLSSGD